MWNQLSIYIIYRYVFINDVTMSHEVTIIRDVNILPFVFSEYYSKISYNLDVIAGLDYSLVSQNVFYR